MDFVNQGFKQISDLGKSLTPGMRLMAGLLVAAILVGVSFLFTGSFQAGDEFLLGGVGFSANEIPAMEAAFGKANLSSYTVVGNRIRTPSGQQARYMAALADAGALPSHFGDHLAKATASVSPFVGAEQRAKIMEVAKQQELSLIIRSMQGVESAAVLYDSQRRGGLRPTNMTTASVSVKNHGGRALEAGQVSTIRHLVAGSIAGLSPKDVTVADLNSGRVHADTSGSDSPGSAMDDPYISRKREYEAMIAEKVLASLSYVPGVTVSVNADLNRELRRREENDLVDPKQTAQVTQREETTSSNQSAPQSGGRPGVVSQGANQPAVLSSSSGGAASSEERSMTETNTIVSKKRTLTDFAALTPERVTVAIGVPGKYLTEVWQQQNPTKPGQTPKDPDTAALQVIERAEIERIRKHVEPLVPKGMLAENDTPAVTVTTFSNLPVAAMAGVSSTDLALTFLSNHGSTLLLVILGLFSLRLLRSFVSQATAAANDAPSASAPGQLLSATVGGDEPQTAEEAKRAGRLKRRESGGMSLRDELVDMVKDDPDAAANILRTWIGVPN